MELDKTYRELLSRIHREILKPEGFKKEGGNFRMFHEGGLCKIINFQRSMFNDGEECRFCINLGLYVQPNPAEPNLRFKEYDCCVRVRAANLAYKTDYWWSIFEGGDMETLFAEVCALLEGTALPWMDQFETRRDVIRAGQRGELKCMIFGNI